MEVRAALEKVQQRIDELETHRSSNDDDDGEGAGNRGVVGGGIEGRSGKSRDALTRENLERWTKIAEKRGGGGDAGSVRGSVSRGSGGMFDGASVSSHGSSAS